MGDADTSPARSERPGSDPSIALVVPIKAFETAKERLSGALSGDERSDLARSMAATVIEAARPLPVFVVCGDATVATWADDRDAEVLWFPHPGLNPAVTFAADQVAARGFDRVAIAHGDLPLATDLAPFVSPTADDGPDTIIVVRDRRAEGTNVLSLPTGRGFTFHYGADSAHAHQVEAQRLGLAVRIIDDERLGWDIDVPEDLSDAPFQGVNPT